MTRYTLFLELIDKTSYSILITDPFIETVLSNNQHLTDYEIVLEFFYSLKWGSNMAYRLPAPQGCFIVL